MIFTILGEVPCIKSSTRRSRNGRLYYTSDVPRYYTSFALQVPKYLKQNIKEDVELILTIFRKDRRKDPANIVDTILDAIQKTGIIANDRSVVKCSYNATIIDKNSPRVVIELSKL